jgi:hypothetical protein
MKNHNFEINYFDRVFGPTGSFSGGIIFIAGLVMVYFYIYALFLIVFGAFVFFSIYRTVINFEHKKVKFSAMIFGFIPVGKWTLLSGEETLTVELYSRVYRAYSRANIPLDVTRADYRVFLKDPSGKFKIPLQKFKTRAEAEYAKGEYEKSLGIQSK